MKLYLVQPGEELLGFRRTEAGASRPEALKRIKSHEGVGQRPGKSGIQGQPKRFQLGQCPESGRDCALQVVLVQR